MAEVRKGIVFGLSGCELAREPKWEVAGLLAKNGRNCRCRRVAEARGLRPGQSQAAFWSLT